MNQVGLITSAHLKPKPIIDKGLYRPDISLNALIQELCDPLRPISINDIINICVKFFFAHRNPDSVRNLVQLKDIESLYALWLRYTILHRQWVKEIDLQDDSKVGDLRYFIANWYGTSMLWDIAPSVEIFQAIIEEILNPKDFDGKYFGVDLWTWTWWLMLAQYILARRKGFSDIYISWVERDEKMHHSTVDLFSNVAWWNFIAWEPLLWDTVNDMTVYNTVLSRTDDRKLTYVSNENIPTCLIKMNGDNDPFFQNLFNVDVWFKDRIIDYTRWFPKKIEYVIICEGHEDVTFWWDFQSRYWLPQLHNLNKTMYSGEESYDENGRDLRVFDHIYPYGIDLWDGIQKLTRVWKILESKPWKWWKVLPARKWRRRWDW